MSLILSSKMHNELRARAARSPAAEICGLLLGRDRVEQIVPTVNCASDPQNRFEIDATALFAALRAERAGGARLIGYYHSHPTGPPAPSPSDVAQAVCDGRIWVIIGAGELACWRFDGTCFLPVPLVITDGS